MKFSILVSSVLASWSVAQEVLQAHDLFSIVDCAGLTGIRPPPANDMGWPTHIEGKVPNPFVVEVRCEVIAEGRLEGCVARTAQQHSLRNLRFVELYVMRSTVADAPRSCGEVTVTFQIPPRGI